MNPKGTVLHINDRKLAEVSQSAQRKLIDLLFVGGERCAARGYYGFFENKSRPLYACTRAKDHRGPHVAHGIKDGKVALVCAVWMDGKDKIEP